MLPNSIQKSLYILLLSTWDSLCIQFQNLNASHVKFADKALKYEIMMHTHF